MTREEFGLQMLLVGVFGVMILGGIAMFGVPRLILYLQLAGFLLVWLCLLPIGLRGLEREA